MFDTPENPKTNGIPEGLEKALENILTTELSVSLMRKTLITLREKIKFTAVNFIDSPGFVEIHCSKTDWIDILSILKTNSDAIIDCNFTRVVIGDSNGAHVILSYHNIAK
jgi:hypothetical protein